MPGITDVAVFRVIVWTGVIVSSGAGEKVVEGMVPRAMVGRGAETVVGGEGRLPLRVVVAVTAVGAAMGSGGGNDIGEGGATNTDGGEIAGSGTDAAGDETGMVDETTETGAGAKGAVDGNVGAGVGGRLVTRENSRWKTGVDAAVGVLFAADGVGGTLTGMANFERMGSLNAEGVFPEPVVAAGTKDGAEADGDVMDAERLPAGMAGVTT